MNVFKINSGPGLSETRKLRNRYEADLFSLIASRYMAKHGVEFQHSGTTIEHVISTGVDENGVEYQDFAYHRGPDYYVPNDPRVSHFGLIRRFIIHIRRELRLPLDELEVGRGYIISGPFRENRNG